MNDGDRAPVARRSDCGGGSPIATRPSPQSPRRRGARGHPLRPPPATTAGRAIGGAGAAPLAPFEWLQGCWRGNVNQREFREHWLPARGGMLIGAGPADAGQTQDYEYLRLETRADGMYFTQFSGDRKAVSFKLA